MRDERRIQRPTLLFYCQHSLGIGHLTRSFALAQALAERFHVVFLNGGRLPPGMPVPAGVEMIDLPPLGMDDGHTLVSRGELRDVDAVRAARRALIERSARRLRPQVLLVELFPFGRKKFADEILPMIRLMRRQPGGPALVACSLRDILVDVRPDQQHHDERARWLADRYFDAVLVHADPGFARLEDSFRPKHPMRTPVHYTGYVVPARSSSIQAARGSRLLVSAGGGIVGEPLFQAALAAHARLTQRLTRLPMRIVVGPFLPEVQWHALQRAAAGADDVQLIRQVPDMAAEMRAARASISQCGYNTALDILVAGVPALVVPYETPTENEQRQRAARLTERGAVLQLGAAELDSERLAAKIDALLAFTPRTAALQMQGAQRTAGLLERLWRDAQTVEKDSSCATV